MVDGDALSHSWSKAQPSERQLLPWNSLREETVGTYELWELPGVRRADSFKTQRPGGVFWLMEYLLCQGQLLFSTVLIKRRNKLLSVCKWGCVCVGMCERKEGREKEEGMSRGLEAGWLGRTRWCIPHADPNVNAIQYLSDDWMSEWMNE